MALQMIDEERCCAGATCWKHLDDADVMHFGTEH